MCKFIKQPFPYFFSHYAANLIFAAVTGIYVSLFLIAFAPWDVIDDGVTIGHFVGYGIIVFTYVSFIIVLGERLFNTDNWTLGKHIVFCISILLELGFCIFLFNLVTRSVPRADYSELFVADLLHSFLIGIPPLIFAAFFVNYLQLQEHLKIAQQFSNNLQKMHQQNDNTTLNLKKDRVDIVPNTKDNFQLDVMDFLFAQSQDNYVEVFYLDNGLQKKVLRISLTKLYEQLHRPHISKCHRSYLVNMNQIISVEGNSNGMQLSLKDIEIKIPVSRSYVSEISEKFSQRVK